MWAPRLPSVAPVSDFSRAKSSPSAAGGSAVSAAMSAGGRAGGSFRRARPSPQARRIHRPQRMKPPPLTSGEPQIEPFARPQVAGEHQRAQAQAERGESGPEPQAGERVAEQEQGRPERVEFARPEAAEADAPQQAEGDKQREGGEEAPRHAARDIGPGAQHGEARRRAEQRWPPTQVQTDPRGQTKPIRSAATTIAPHRTRSRR